MKFLTAIVLVVALVAAASAGTVKHELGKEALLKVIFDLIKQAEVFKCHFPLTMAN